MNLSATLFFVEGDGQTPRGGPLHGKALKWAAPEGSELSLVIGTR